MSKRGDRRFWLIVGLPLAIGAVVLIGVYAGVLFNAGDEVAAIDPNDPQQVSSGRQIYAEYCAECHGANLEGESNWRQRRADGTLSAPPHDASGHTWHHDDDLLFRYTKFGGAALLPEGVASGMPGFGDAMSDAEINAVLAFIKSRWPEDIRARQRMIDERSR